MPFIYKLLTYIFLLFPLLLFSFTSNAAWFRDASGNDMDIFDVNDSRSYDLFQDNATRGVDGVYLKVSTGLSWMNDIKYEAYKITQKDYSIPAEVAVGVRIPRNFSLEFFGNGVFYQNSQIFFNKESLNYKFTLYGSGAAFNMYLWNYYNFTPYVGCGIGLFFKSAKITDATEKFKDMKELPKESAFHYRIIAGIEYQASDNMSFFSEYRYQDFGEFKKESLILNSISLGIIMRN